MFFDFSFVPDHRIRPNYLTHDVAHHATFFACGGGLLSIHRPRENIRSLDARNFLHVNFGDLFDQFPYAPLSLFLCAFAFCNPFVLKRALEIFSLVEEEFEAVLVDVDYLWILVEPPQHHSSRTKLIVQLNRAWQRVGFSPQLVPCLQINRAEEHVKPFLVQMRHIHQALICQSKCVVVIPPQFPIEGPSLVGDLAHVDIISPWRVPVANSLPVLLELSPHLITGGKSCERHIPVLQLAAAVEICAKCDQYLILFDIDTCTALPDLASSLSRICPHRISRFPAISTV